MIVADAGPLITFARIGRLDLLQAVAGQVLLPDAVHEDVILKGKGRPGAAELERAAWIQRKTLTDRTPLSSLPAHLHPGEAEAILLAEELSVPLLLDERRGRRTALDRGIDVLGSLAILAEAKRRALIPQVKPLVAALLAAGYWIDEELVPAFLQEVGEA
jgi:hypothetical protein